MKPTFLALLEQGDYEGIFFYSSSKTLNDQDIRDIIDNVSKMMKDNMPKLLIIGSFESVEALDGDRARMRKLVDEAAIHESGMRIVWV
ncbi:hypothetical protein ACI2KR_06590 [Pseudomonas luteola]